MKRLTRRQFIQVGVAGAALLAATRLLDFPKAAANAKFKRLDDRTAELIGALVPVVLAGALPVDAKARAGAIAETVEAFDRAVSGLAPAIQEEIGDLLGLLVYAPTRIAVAGVWSTWREASVAEIAQFLQDWRDSRFELKRSGYRALTNLIQAGWYDNPLAWRVIGYPGPPDVSATPEKRP